MKRIAVIKTFLFAVMLTAGLGLGGQAAFAAETYYLGDYESPDPGEYDWEDIYYLMEDLEDGDTIQITAPTSSVGMIDLGANDNITIIGLGEDTTIDLSIRTSAANLTLQDITMTATSGYGVNFIYTHPHTLTVEGIVSITGNSGSEAVYSSGGLTISGSGSFNAKGGDAGGYGGDGIFVNGDIIISTQTTATGGNGNNGGGEGIVVFGDIIISAQTTATGGNSPYNGSYGISTSGDIIISDGVVVEATSGTGSIAGGDFWLNSSNKISIMADGATLIGSNRNFEAKIEVANGVSNLTLENITMTAPSGSHGVTFLGAHLKALAAEGTTARSGSYAVSFSVKGVKTLTVEGTVSISGSGAYAVYSTSDLEINGSGSLNAKGGTGGTGIWTNNNITISAPTTATGGNGNSGGHGIYSSSGDIIISAQTTATGGNGSVNSGGNGIDAGNDIIISAQTTATGGNGNVYGGNGIYVFSGELEISGVVTTTGGSSANPSNNDSYGNAVFMYIGNQRVILEKAGANGAKLILKDGANTTKTDSSLNLTMAQALEGKAKWVVSPVSAIIGGVKETNVAVLTGTSEVVVYLNRLQTDDDDDDNSYSGDNSGSGSSSGGGGSTSIKAKTADYQIVMVEDGEGNQINSFDTLSKTVNDGVMTLKITENSNSYITSINLQMLKELEDANEGGRFSIETPDASYQLPFDMTNVIIGLSDYIDDNNLTLKDLFLELTMRKLEGEELTKAQEAYKKAFPDGETVSDFYEVSLAVYDKDGKKLNIDANQFNEAISFSLDTEEKGNAVLVYNKNTDSFSFVPAKFASDKANVTTKHHSIYVAVKNDVDFDDVNAGAWYSSFVTNAANKAVVTGVGDNLYQPERSVTRAEFVQMIVNAMQLSKTEIKAEVYSDVEKGAWYYDAVMKAKTVGLLDTFTGESFNPNTPITREEMAVILAAAVALQPVAVTADFIDLSTVFSDYDEFNESYLVDMELIYKLKIMQGTGDGKFEPQGVTTRAQAATVLMSMLNALDMVD